MKRKWMGALISLVLVAVLAGAVWAQNFQTRNYMQSKDRWVIGGSLDAISGGEIDIESGGTLKIGGTAVAVTAAELNLLDGSTAGTAVASKAIVLDASNRVTGLRAYVQDATTAVTLSAADSGGVFISGASSTTYTLPTCATGLTYTFCITSATTTYIDCGSSDRIAGTNADGDRISADAVGECVTLVGRGTDGALNWCVASMFGTWSDAN